ncbi:MAG: hypothetical protein JW959_08080 [Pirellulales bacterium]|nr:hypothetical protein [Pirellulales bacterium]
MTSESTEKPAGEQINLKDAGLAAFLAWMLPGLGHFYQGRRAKAALYFVCIMGLFVFGLCLGSSNEQCINSEGKIGYGRAVYFSWKKGDRTWAYICQVCVGLPALPAVIQAYRMNHNQKVWCGGFMAPPRPNNDNDKGPNKEQPTLHDLHRVLNRRFDLGRFFATVAGLLNVLAIYDAYAGPVTIAPGVKKKEEAESESPK